MSYKSVKEVVTLLVKYDFKQVRQTGSHMVFTNGKRVVVVPNHRGGIEKGTYYSILRQRVCQNANFRIFSGFSILIINKLQLYNLSKHAF